MFSLYVEAVGTWVLPCEGIFAIPRYVYNYNHDSFSFWFYYFIDYQNV